MPIKLIQGGNATFLTQPPEGSRECGRARSVKKAHGDTLFNFKKSKLNATQLTMMTDANSPFILSPERTEVFSDRYREDQSSTRFPLREEASSVALTTKGRHLIPSKEERAHHQVDVAGIVSNLIDKELRGAFKSIKAEQEDDNESNIVDCKFSVINNIK